MASALESKPIHSNSNIIDTFQLGNESHGKKSDLLPPSGRQGTTPRRTAEGDYIQITAGQGRADEGMHSSKHKSKCTCSEKRHVQHDAFTSPHSKMLQQRVNSANKLKHSNVAKCEAVQIVDLKVANIDREMQNELSPEDKLVSIQRPGSAQSPQRRRKKHHIMLISREPRDSSTPRKQAIASQSYEQLSNLAVRYADHRKNPKVNEDEGEGRAEGAYARPNTPYAPKEIQLSTARYGDDKSDEQDIKQKSSKQVRINSAVQVMDDSENGSKSVRTRRSTNTIREITKLRQDSSGNVSSRTRPETPGFKIPENLPPGSIVRIQHTSKGKIKVITGTEGNFTTTILEGAKKRPGGHRPATTLDLMDDVLVITRKASTSKDLITSRPPSGNARAIDGTPGNDNKSPTRRMERTRTSEGFVHRKSDNNQIQIFKERAAAAAHSKAAQLVKEAKQKKIEAHNPYVNVDESKKEVTNNAVSMYYQNIKDQPPLSARQQRWRPEDSLAGRKEDKQPPGAPHRYKLVTDTSKASRHVTFVGDKNKSKSSDNLDLVEEDYVSPTRYKWELEYEGYIPQDKDKDTNRADDSDSDYDIVDAQTLAAKQYYAARHNYVKSHRRVRSETRRQHSPEKAKTHTVIMSASKNNTNQENSLPPKQQLWSNETLLQSSKSPYYSAQPVPPRSPSRSRPRRRSAKSRAPNTNIVSDQTDDSDKKGKTTELFDDNAYENYAHAKFQSRSRPSSSSRNRPKVVDRETMVKLLHMTMPKKPDDEDENKETEITKL